MIKHINYQTITQNGKPMFVVIPYDEFINKIMPSKKELLQTTIPHEVVGVMVKNEVSLIKAWREYLGFTQQEVAEKLGISQAALSQIEANNSKPRKATLQKLAAIYDLDLKQLR